MTTPVDHWILTDIWDWMNDAVPIERLSESLEFFDPESGECFEVIVRPIPHREFIPQ